MRRPLIIVFVFLLVGCGCARNGKSTRNFHLPEGDAQRGRAAFVALQCHTCHTVATVPLPTPTVDPSQVLALGGEVTRMRTYGDLLTAIIHPAYDLSDKLPPRERAKRRPSPMRDLNEVMTVRQLVDLVTFLHPQYRQLDQLYEIDYRMNP